VPPRTDSKPIAFRKIRCLLAHDHVLLRQGLRSLLQDEPDIEIVAEAGNAAECLRKVHELRPDVLIAGIATFGLPPLESELLATRESPHTKVVFVSAQQENGSQGARPDRGNCCLRQTSAEELAQMVRTSFGTSAQQDAANLSNSHSVAHHLDKAQHSSPQRPAPTLVPHERVLTARERQVLKLLAEGKTVRAAATALGLSSKTVDAHKFNLMRKLGLHNKAELVMWAIQKRVVKIPANF